MQNMTDLMLRNSMVIQNLFIVYTEDIGACEGSCLKYYSRLPTVERRQTAAQLDTRSQ